MQTKVTSFDLALTNCTELGNYVFEVLGSLNTLRYHGDGCCIIVKLGDPQY